MNETTLPCCSMSTGPAIFWLSLTASCDAVVVIVFGQQRVQLTEAVLDGIDLIMSSIDTKKMRRSRYIQQGIAPS